MKKLLSSVLILTLSLNSFGANCSATNETQIESSENTVSEKIKKIDDILSQIKNKTLTEKEESSIEKTKTEQKDDSESCENKNSGSTIVNAQKNKNKPVKKSFREKQIEKLNKEIQNLEKTSNKKYFLKKFFINTAKILGIGLVLLSIYCNFSTYTATKTSYDYDGLNYIDGYLAGQSDCYDECYKNGY